QGTPYEELKSTLKQSSMVCFSKEDPGAPAKSIKKFRKEEDTTSPDFKGGWIIEQAFLSDEKFEYLVNLKSKEEMIAEILGLLQGPSAQLLGVIKSSQETLCRALEAVKKQ
ncbi:MAG: 50S ribosomal protein L10, partial [Cytophagales bacterium]